MRKEDYIKHVESTQIKKDIPAFKVGDSVRIFSKIKEEGKTRLQAFEGTVIRFQREGLRRSFTVRRISYGEGIEKTFPMHSPSIDSIKVVRKGKARRAKLYYLRRKTGKKTKVEGEDIFQTAPDAPAREEGAQ